MTLAVDIQLRRKDFELRFEGEFTASITGLFGPSGSGKTTLLHCIAGLIRPDYGRISQDEEILYDKSLQIHLPARKRRIGLVFQDHLLFPHLTVEGNLRYGQNGPRSERKKKRCEIAELLGIGHLLKRKTTSLSGGEKQRVTLGRAILASPKLLLLDEPFTGLDQGLKRQLIPYLKDLYEVTRIPMILVSHSAEEMLELAEEMLFIENGRLFAQGKFREDPKVRSAGKLCSSDSADHFKSMRNHLIRNHSLQFGWTEKTLTDDYHAAAETA